MDALMPETRMTPSGGGTRTMVLMIEYPPPQDPDQLPLFDVQPDGTFVLPEAS